MAAKRLGFRTSIYIITRVDQGVIAETGPVAMWKALGVYTGKAKDDQVRPIVATRRIDVARSRATPLSEAELSALFDEIATR